MKNKFNLGRFILSFVAIILIFKAATFFISYNNLNRYFYREKRIVGRELYENLMELNETNLPQTPEELLDKYFKSYKLLYGKYLKNKKLVPEIISKQRLLFSDKMKLLNEEVIQNSLVVEGIDYLNSNKHRLTDLSYGEIEYYNYYLTRAVVTVKKTIDYKNDFYFKYYIQKSVNGNWVINSWKSIKEREQEEIADESFTNY